MFRVASYLDVEMKIGFLALFFVSLCFGEATAFPVPSPTWLYIEAGKSFGSIKLTNDSNEAANLQLSVKEWCQNSDGSAVLSPTHDLELNQSEAHLKPKESTNIIVHVLILPPVSSEKTYKLVMAGLDIPASSQGSEIKATVDMPIFVWSANWQERISVSETTVNANDIRFNVLNKGKRVVRPDKMSISGWDENGVAIFNVSRRGWYIFPDGYLSYLFSVTNADCKRLKRLEISIFSKDSAVKSAVRDLWGARACDNVDINASDFRPDRPIVKSISRPALQN